jgi:hypothetical protein
VADRPELAEIVAGWHFAEWGRLTTTLSLADRIRGMAGRRRRELRDRDMMREGVVL